MRIRKPLTEEQLRRKTELQLLRRRAAGQAPIDVDESIRRLNEGKRKWLEATSSAERVLLFHGRRNAALGKGPEHELARCWSLMAPNGQVYQFQNLVHFVRENKQLFTDEEREERNYGKNKAVPRISRQLAALSPRKKHPVEVVHGWRWHVNGEDI